MRGLSVHSADVGFPSTQFVAVQNHVCFVQYLLYLSATSEQANQLSELKNLFKIKEENVLFLSNGFETCTTNSCSRKNEIA